MANCKHCGKEFTPRDSRHKYCSKRCQQVAYYRAHPEIEHEYRIAHREEARARARAHYRANRERHRANAKAWEERNKEKSRAYKHAYYLANREAINERSRLWAKSNPERRREIVNAAQRRRYHSVQQSDPKYRIDNTMGSAIYDALKHKKGRRRWESLVGYTTEELMAHLENQFQDWMTWENYGEWEIDHIIPKSWFKYKDTDDPQFKECWALNNLQPLRAIDNMIKGNREIYLVPRSEEDDAGK